jgi:hypothetical protein
MGHSDEHQPLLPLNTIPPMNAKTNAPPTSAAVAVGLVLNKKGRHATAVRNTIMPKTGAYSFHHAGGVRAKVAPVRRGN